MNECATYIIQFFFKLLSILYFPDDKLSVYLFIDKIMHVNFI